MRQEQVKKGKKRGQDSDAETTTWSGQNLGY